MQYDCTASRAIFLYIVRVNEVNAELRRLRLLAQPPISARAMAAELGITSSAYHFYESVRGFKQRFLSMDIARRIAAVLSRRGVDPADVMALAGVSEGQSGPPQLSAEESQLLEEFRRMAPAARRSYLHVGRMMNGTPSPTSATAYQRSAKDKENRPDARP